MSYCYRPFSSKILFTRHSLSSRLMAVRSISVQLAPFLKTAISLTRFITISAVSISTQRQASLATALIPLLMPLPSTSLYHSLVPLTTDVSFAIHFPTMDSSVFGIMKQISIYSISLQERVVP